MVTRIHQRLRDLKGQGMTEYILLLVIIIALAMAFKDPILNIIRQKTDQVGGNIMGFNP